jgi:pimeloyl-ACP methyl ester carboxylesterase
MALLTVGRRNSKTIELYYEDRGAGAPVVLVHGYPLASESWARQVDPLLEEGHRVVTYDRRGSGRSSRTPDAHDWVSLARDLDILMTTLDLQQAALVGHSLGAGDVLRYLRLYGSERVSRVALITPLEAYPDASYFAGIAPAPPDVRADLAALDVPVLVIRTALSRIPGTGQAESIDFDGLSLSRVVILTNAGRRVLRTHAAEVNASLLDFIDG